MKEGLFTKDKRLLFIVDVFFLLVISLLAYIVFFQNLGVYSARMWDEARNGINAIEMLQNKNLIVTYFKGMPDLWNTKPPFLIWCIVLSFKIFGINEFALRLPSAIAAFLTVFTIYLFFSRVLKDKITGFLSCLILFSAFGFSDIHIARSGDYDAMLTFLVFVAIIFLYLFFEQQKKRFLYASVLFWIAASLTKGIAALLVIPSIVFFLFFTKRIRVVVKNRDILRSMLLFLTVVGAYYGIRELISPGYLRAVWFEDVFGRATKSGEEIAHPLLYYWDWLRTFRFQHFIYFVPFSFAAYFLIKEKRYKRWILFSYLIVVIYYLVISIARSKNIWYDAQLYPFMSMLVAIFFTSTIRKIPAPFWLIPTIVLVFYLQRYIRTNIAYIQRPDLEKSNSCLKYGYLFRQYKLANNSLVGVHKRAEYCMPFIFYMQREYIVTKEITALTVTDTVLTCDTDTIKDIEIMFKTQIVFENTDGCKILRIKQ